MWGGEVSPRAGQGITSHAPPVAGGSVRCDAGSPCSREDPGHAGRPAHAPMVTLLGTIWPCCMMAWISAPCGLRGLGQQRGGGLAPLQDGDAWRLLPGRARTCSDPDATSCRSRSPAEMCSQPNVALIRSHCVPLPALSAGRHGARGWGRVQADGAWNWRGISAHAGPADSAGWPPPGPRHGQSSCRMMWPP